MTNLTKVVRRKVQTVSGAELVVALSPEGIWIREPRRRVAYLLPYGAAFQEAVMRFMAAEKRRKLAERKARRVKP